MWKMSVGNFFLLLDTWKTMDPRPQMRISVRKQRISQNLTLLWGTVWGIPNDENVWHVLKVCLFHVWTKTGKPTHELFRNFVNKYHNSANWYDICKQGIYLVIVMSICGVLVHSGMYFERVYTPYWVVNRVFSPLYLYDPVFKLRSRFSCYGSISLL